jgi:photosynthetic reaction center cytochrome c subunit
MTEQPNDTRQSRGKFAFWIVFVAVAGVLVFLSYWVIAFVNSAVQVDETAENLDETSVIYANFYTKVEDYVSAESYLAMAEYLQGVDAPINVQVLEGETTDAIVGYMLNHFVGGMRVDCTYCHSLENFAADEWDDPAAMERKNIAREHLLVSQYLNQEWLANLGDLSDQKQPSGSQITCATCHYGEPLPEPWPGGVATIPDDLRLPLDQELGRDTIDILNVNARDDISLDTVQYQQQVMYHMNVAMNVGCTHCHNSRYFPSWEVPAKEYAQHMTEMSAGLWQNYAESMGNKQPSCTLCHRGAVIPPGAAVSADVMPDAIAYDPE